MDPGDHVRVEQRRRRRCPGLVVAGIRSGWVRFGGGGQQRPGGTPMAAGRAVEVGGHRAVPI